MKGKILNAKIQGRTTNVTKQTKYGTFHGRVTCADEDMDVQNELDGYLFAEAKCNCQAYRKRAKYLEQRAIGIKHAYNVLKNSGIGIDDPVMQKLNRQIKIAYREADKAKEVYESYELYYNNLITSSIATRRKIKEMNKNKN